MFRLLKLKPPNGWNAVGWELVIVTVGVLMALALQEWAGKVTSAAQTDEARKALRQELRGHYYNAAEWRRFSPCVTAQLNEIEQRIVTSAARLKRAPLDRADGVVRMAVVAPRRLYDDSAWTGTLQQGTAFQLTASERHTLSNAYWLAQHMERLRGQFDEADTRLLATTRPIELDPQVRQSLIHSIDQVHTAN